jgi:hypothetical protein
MTNEKYRIICSVLQITLSWFNVLRSACTLNHLTDRRQVSKLDQFFYRPCSVMINYHVTLMTHHQDSSIFQMQQLQAIPTKSAATGFRSNRIVSRCSMPLFEDCFHTLFNMVQLSAFNIYSINSCNRTLTQYGLKCPCLSNK